MAFLDSCLARLSCVGRGQERLEHLEPRTLLQGVREKMPPLELCRSLPTSRAGGALASPHVRSIHNWVFWARTSDAVAHWLLPVSHRKCHSGPASLGSCGLGRVRMEERQAVVTEEGQRKVHLSETFKSEEAGLIPCASMET